jgi:uncharacterized Zn finger protein
MVATRLEFVIEGSQGDHYLATFEKEGETLHAFCTCQAGENGLYCKHRFGLMDGSAARLLSGNAGDVERLKGLMRGTELEAAYNRVKAATKAHDDAKKALDKAKKDLARAMYR